MKKITPLATIAISFAAGSLFAQATPPAPATGNNAMPPAAAPANPPKKRPEDVGFTWGNDVPEMVRRGNNEYESGAFKNAEDFYRDAQMKKPDQAATAFNLGLSEAKQGNHENASSEFNRALNLAGTDASVRAKTLYNLGSTHLNDALKLLKPAQKPGAQPNTPLPQPNQKDRDAAIRSALSSIDAYNGALKLNPNDANAKFNKAQAQHLLEFAALPPPKKQDDQQQNQDNSEQNKDDQQQPNQQQQNKDDKQDQQDNKDNQQQPQPKDPQENKDQQQQPKPDQNDNNQDQKQEAGQDKNKKDESKQGDQQDPNNKDKSDEKPEDQQQAGGGSDQKPMELSEEQARELLNLLGDQQNIVLRKGGHPYARPEPKKDW